MNKNQDPTLILKCTIMCITTASKNSFSTRDTT